MNDEFVYVIQRPNGHFIDRSNHQSEAKSINWFLADSPGDDDWKYYESIGYKVVRLVVWE